MHLAHCRERLAARIFPQLFILAAIGMAGQPLGAGDAEAAVASRVRQLVSEGGYDEAVLAYNAWCLANSPRIEATTYLAQLAAWLRRCGQDVGDFQGALLEPRDRAYLERMACLRRIAAAAAAGAADPAAAASRLFDFVVSEIAPHAGDGFAERPEDILVRGHASCDQMSWVLVSLAEQAGIPGLIIYLRKPGAAESHHTLAALRVTGSWRAFDPFCALSYAADPGGADLLAAIADPSRLRQALPRGADSGLFDPEDLIWSIFNVYATARGCLPRWSVFEQLTGLGPEGPRLWVNPLQRQARLQEELAQALGISCAGLNARLARLVKERMAGKRHPEMPESFSGPEIRPFRLAIDVDRAYSEPGWLLRQQGSVSQGPYRHARLCHLLGQPGQALEILAKKPGDAASKILSTEKVDSGSRLSGARLRFEALALQASGRWAEAAEIYARIADKPGFWAEHSSWNQGLCLIRAGQEQDAIKVLGKVRPPRQAAALELIGNLNTRHVTPRK